MSQIKNYLEYISNYDTLKRVVTFGNYSLENIKIFIDEVLTCETNLVEFLEKSNFSNLQATLLITHINGFIAEFVKNKVKSIFELIVQNITKLQKLLLILLFLFFSDEISDKYLKLKLRYLKVTFKAFYFLEELQINLMKTSEIVIFLNFIFTFLHEAYGKFLFFYSFVPSKLLDFTNIFEFIQYKPNRYNSFEREDFYVLMDFCKKSYENDFNSSFSVLKGRERLYNKLLFIYLRILPKQVKKPEDEEFTVNNSNLKMLLKKLLSYNEFFSPKAYLLLLITGSFAKEQDY
jgi:hypothetical protein